ncbi:DUF1272 domain-containing protein [Bacillus suaedaesalsae]|uniref:DUF1272 domain-containing protein n=1 Tax=Bacillus suaedaesalsae TaxID=2810349 RepID=A0ABS2DGR8_9BACI|nr:DUF1272 domain-containing protein [Bacillus suaedaesalsae]MBM6617677.1 DUF1272 domain-containing protein [Bacillus suaedaesalsae]
MALEMRSKCERCEVYIEEQTVAYICVHECTFCTTCTEKMNHICPNCSGELVRRPRKPENACTL